MSLHDTFRSVVLNEGIKTLGDRRGRESIGVFSCLQIRSITIPSTLEMIGDKTFYACKKLRRVKFREGCALREIGEAAFHSCRSLRNVRLLESIEHLGERCFSESGVEVVTIPSSFTALDPYAFYSCYRLKKVVFRDGSKLRKICDNCFEYSGLDEFIAPPGLKEIHCGAFYGCKKLKRVVLNEGLEAISGGIIFGVFESSGIEEITLPSTLKQIDLRTFINCDSLQTIYVKSGCEADLSHIHRPESTQIIYLPD